MPEPFLPRKDSLGYQVNHLARLLAHALRDRIEPLGVAPGQFAQLLALYETDGLTQAALCERVQVEQPTMANTLARMERDDLITRVPDPLDRRRSLVWLTQRARDVEPALVAAAREVNTRATQGLTNHQVAALMSTIAAAIANLNTDNASAPPRQEDQS
ncbi:MAG: MarR family winged helix-turn-helix transcriptional regulator [Ornithinimicrobium sp.]